MTLRPLSVLPVFIITVALPFRNVQAQTEAATRQYAAAVGFQNQRLFDAAIDEWQTFLRRFPDDSRADFAHHYLGTCCLQENQHDKAITAFQTVLQKYATFRLRDAAQLNLGIAWYGRAQQSQADRDFQQAERALDAVVQQYPRSEHVGRALYYRGECLYQLKQFADSEAAYQQLLSTVPGHELAADALYARGTAQEAQKKSAAAAATFATFSKTYPGHELLTEVQMRQAELLFEQQQFEAAGPIFATIVSHENFPLADLAMLREARCEYEQGRLTQAARLYWDMPRRFPKTKHYDEAILAGAKCWFLVDEFARARSGFEQTAQRSTPLADEATQWLARTWLKEGQADKALQVAEAGLKKLRNQIIRPPMELVRLDAVYELSDDKNQPATLYAEFARRHPDHDLAPQALYMAALSHLEATNYDVSRQHCERFLAKYSSADVRPDVLFVSAEANLLLRDHDQAVAQYRQFLNSAPGHQNAEQARVRLGLALVMDEQHDAAIQWLSPRITTLGDSSLKSEALSLIGRSHVGAKRYGEAVAALSQSLQLSADRDGADETMLALASAYREIGEDRNADQQLKELVRRYPDSDVVGEVEYRLGEAAYADENFDEALRRYRTVTKRWPESDFAPYAQYGVGWTLFNQGEFRRASVAVTDLISRYPKATVRPRGFYVRAMCSYQLGELADVAGDIQQFLASQPEKNDAHDARYVHGLALAGQKNFSQAIRVYRRILEDAKNYSGADKVAYELGWCHVEVGDQPQAIEVFEQLAKNWPESPLAAEALFRAGETQYAAEQYAVAAENYRQAAAAAGDPDIAEKSLHKLGWSHMEADQLAAAQQAFEQQVGRFPSGELAADANFLIGECHFLNRNWQAARSAFMKVANGGDTSYAALACFRVGECSASLDDWANSRQWHERTLNEFPEFDLRPEARYGLGWALQNEGRFTAAMDHFEQVTEETDTETAAKARFMIGQCLFAQKQHKAATRHFLKGAFQYNHPEWSANSYYEAARCFEVLRDTEQAKNCYEKLVTNYPSHQRVNDAHRRLQDL